MLCAVRYKGVSMAYRIERINSEMLKSLSIILQSRLQDPRITGFLNVTSVDCAKDLKTAKVYVAVSGVEEGEIDAVFEAVKSSGGFIRKELASEFKDLRTVPSLTFVLDKSGSYGAHIDKLLAGLNR